MQGHNLTQRRGGAEREERRMDHRFHRCSQMAEGLDTDFQDFKDVSRAVLSLKIS